jgi:hypothetical protein
MSAAKAVDGVMVRREERVDGMHFLQVDAPDGYESFKKLPEVVEFEGRLYGLTGFNSDHGAAYYRNPAPVALARG